MSQHAFAALDLGSNSFHMLVAKADDKGFSIVDRIREPVRLGAGLTAEGYLDDAAQERALACLSRLSQRIRGLPASHVRAVGTNTLRVAKNSRQFLRRCKDVLGHRIDVLPGDEEARLIYLGVAHGCGHDEARRLVIDIGGGSTECIVGQRFEPLLKSSLFMGCVSYTRRFFVDGRLTHEAFKRAEMQATREAQSLKKRCAKLQWTTCLGASGTITTIGEILSRQGLSDDGITADGLRRLRLTLLNAASLDKLSLPGVSPDRLAVLPGGLAILIALFDVFAIRTMHVSPSALREGLLYELLDIRHESVRDATLRRMMARYAVDTDHVRRTKQTLKMLFDAAGKGWNLDRSPYAHLLCCAAQLHEIGLSISYSGYHKHGAYLILNSDMPGFARDERQLLATLVRTHRRKLTKSLFDDLSDEDAPYAPGLSMVLRLAVLLNRSRDEPALTCFSVKCSPQKMTLQFTEKWLEKNPLTAADLQEEASQIESLGFKLSIDAVSKGKV